MKKPFLSYTPTEEKIRDHEFYRSNRLLLWVSVLCFGQMCVMALLVVVFFSSPALAHFLFEYLAPAAEYVPALVKYRQVLPESKTPFDFATVSAIYILFLVIDVAAIAGLAGIMARNFPRRVEFMQTQEAKLRLLGAACFFFLPTLFFVWGDYDLRHASSSTNLIFYGDYMSAFAKWCFLIPVGNWFSAGILRLSMKSD